MRIDHARDACAGDDRPGGRGRGDDRLGRAQARGGPREQGLDDEAGRRRGESNGVASRRDATEAVAGRSAPA
jgi:hypothetical protein